LVHGGLVFSFTSEIDIRRPFDKLMLVTSRIGSFNTKINYCTANLDCLVEAGQQRGSLLNKHQGSKLRLVILEHKFAIFKLDLSMASAYGDIINPQVAFMAST